MNPLESAAALQGQLTPEQQSQLAAASGATYQDTS